MKDLISTQQRSEGVLLGVAVGDLMGSPFEGYDITNDPNENPLFGGYQDINPDDVMNGWKPKAAQMINHIRALPNMMASEYIGYLGTNFWDYGETTDDTAQSIVLATSLVENRGLQPPDVAARLVQWYDGGNGRGMGGTTALSLQLQDELEINPPFGWDEAGAVARRLTSRYPVAYKGRNHQNPYPVRAVPSNGALMRAAPVGVWFRNNTASRREAARDQTIITHAFDECIDTARVQTDLVADLTNGVSKGEAIARAREIYPTVFSEIKRALIQDTDELGHTGGAFTTLGIAIDALETTDNFHDAILSTINSTVLRKFWMSDVDTYGAVTGALAGACYGVDDIPREWYELRHPDGDEYDLRPCSAAYIRELGRKLVTHSS